MFFTLSCCCCFLLSSLLQLLDVFGGPVLLLKALLHNWKIYLNPFFPLSCLFLDLATSAHQARISVHWVYCTALISWSADRLNRYSRFGDLTSSPCENLQWFILSSAGRRHFLGASDVLHPDVCFCTNHHVIRMRTTRHVLVILSQNAQGYVEILRQNFFFLSVMLRIAALARSRWRFNTQTKPGLLGCWKGHNYVYRNRMAL